MISALPYLIAGIALGIALASLRADLSRAWRMVQQRRNANRRLRQIIAQEESDNGVRNR